MLDSEVNSTCHAMYTLRLQRHLAEVEGGTDGPANCVWQDLASESLR